MRLRRAGNDKELFASDAIGLLHDATPGSLREVDRIATWLLREAARLAEKRVERDIIGRAVGTTSGLEK